MGRKVRLRAGTRGPSLLGIVASSEEVVTPTMRVAPAEDPVAGRPATVFIAKVGDRRHVRVRVLPRARLGARRVVAILGVLAALLAAGIAGGAAPSPCGGQAQISDVTGDGHHNTTDLESAWLSESSGHLQAVIRVGFGNWAPDHDDYVNQVAGFALLFGVGGQVHYVRVVAPRPSQPPIRYDYGTWTEAGGFASSGPTTGALVSGSGGTATIDVPAATGAAPGATLKDLFALTYDDQDTSAPTHWVDRAPGGITPAGTDYGADYVVGSCGGPGGTPGVGAGGVSAVQLSAPKRRVGSGRVRVRGSIAPARGDVPVDLTVAARRDAVRHLKTAADGGFTTSVALAESSRLRAVAGGLRSQTLTVTMMSRTRIKVRRLRGSGVLVRGRVSPALPGRVLLLRTTAYKPTARTRARKGRFSFRFKRLPRGRYQAVFIPSKGRAERSTSNKGAVR
jgi:hypothetical protein